MTDTVARPDAYPVWWEADVVLRDGSVAHVRPIVPNDADRLRRFHAGQSAESIYLRFFAPLKTLSDKDVARFTQVDYDWRVALVATVHEDIIGVARFDRLDETTAEVAFHISDAHQGKGVGSVLLEHLAAIGQERGVSKFVADVLPQNRKMIQVFTEAGYEVNYHFDDGVIAVAFTIEPTEHSQAVRLSREHRAEALSVRSALFPESIAVIGASRRVDSIGHQLLTNIRAGGFTGRVHAVNIEARHVQGLEAHSRVSEIPDHIDLAVVAVPAASVQLVVQDCATAGVKTLLVVSAGFAESGPAGEKRQHELLRTARSNGMRVIGPNSFGVINSHPDVRLNATLAHEIPPAGTLGLVAQSGALGIAVLALAARRNLGISVFASAGNRVDVSGNDFMQYWIDDEDTHAVGLYLESVGNPRKFSRIARQLALRKPVIVVKSAISSYGVPPGHRVRPTKVPPAAFDALLRQAGVIRVENVHQLFDVAQLVVHQPLPRGDRVAIVGNSDALGALTAQACVSWGLEVTHGPVALPAEANAADFSTVLDAAFADDQVDSVLTCFIPPLVTPDEDVAHAVVESAGKSDKPCAATFLGMVGVTEALSGGYSLNSDDLETDEADNNNADNNGTDNNGTDSNGADRKDDRGVRRDRAPRRAVPAYLMPEDAVRALAAATRYGQWRARERGELVEPSGLDLAAAERIVEGVLADAPAGRTLTSIEAESLLAAYGVKLWLTIPSATADEAVAAAEQLGYPVVIKSISPAVRHQPGQAAMHVDLQTEASVRDSFEALSARLSPLDADTFVVQRMATPGVACVVRTAEDPVFGPVVSFSIAGPPTDLLGDIGYRIPPLTDVDVTDLISSVKASPLLDGYRGAAVVDRAALADLIARVSVLADRQPDVASLEINPVIVHPGGVDVLGVEIVVTPSTKRTDDQRRALT
ncbi:MAG TPA: GNAT family N-acetyltransferase [Dermatophilaceae bacterium]|nr:GNAT family N-acetyltransferase [Dermatophilaceae bacterium]